MLLSCPIGVKKTLNGYKRKILGSNYRDVSIID